MIKYCIYLMAAACSLPVVKAGPNSTDLIIWDDGPAVEWDVAYPVGNGRLGAMPFGQFPKEKMLINEETIWAGGPAKVMPDNSFEYLEQVRELEAAGQYAEADTFFEEHLQTEISPDSYQLAGWLSLEYLNAGPLRDRVRALDLQTGIARATYSLSDGSTIVQEVYAGGADDVIVINISSDKAVDLALSLDGGSIQEGDIVKTAAADGVNGTRYVCRIRVQSDGAVRAAADTLEVAEASSATILISIATDFHRTDSQAKLPDGWQSKVLNDLDALKLRSPESIRSRAVEEHRSYFDRAQIDLGTTPDKILAMSIRERLQRIREGGQDDPDLMETYFQFGRYLLIASSRPGTLPANLQGIWNPHTSAPWGSDYHLNINLQMNYWLADTTSLSELHQPLFDLIRYFQPKGKEMARRMGMQGWCMGHCTDVWGNARIMAPRAYWGGSLFGGQWLTLHILDYYRFNRDPEVLKENWEALTASVRFIDSWLIPGPEPDLLMARPACSPENIFTYVTEEGETQPAALSAGNSFDQFMIKQVFSDYLEAAEALGKTEDSFVQEIRKKQARIFMPKVGDDGRLMEWRLPFGEREPGHRHISHVIGAYPGNQINLDNDPVLHSAVTKTLDGRLSRGGAHTGWSRAWIIGMFARLSDGERAYENLHAILAKSTLDNLWDSHPPFQIDGNFGSSAAMAEMLLHSHNNEIKLLPALPAQWPDGMVRGLRARGDYTVDIRWKDGALLSAVVQAGDRAASEVAVVYGDTTLKLTISPGQSREITMHSFAGDRP